MESMYNESTFKRIIKIAYVFKRANVLFNQKLFLFVAFACT